MATNFRKIFVFAGTRPEIIKMAPVVRELRERKAPVHFCFTGQHIELATPFLNFFELKPDSQLELMSPGQSLGQLTSRAAAQIDTFMEKQGGGAAALVQGDTTTAFVAALCAFYHQIPVGHVEAGLRTSSIREPFPEEANRRLISKVATWHYAPTKMAYDALMSENVDKSVTLTTGNTGIDSLLWTAARAHQPQNKDLQAARGKKLVLVTAHRRENIGAPLENITQALSKLAAKFKDHVFVLPVHKNPKVVETVTKNLKGIPNFILTDPLEYLDLVWTMKSSELILSDSGGIQEEAPSLRKTVLVLRNETERPEAVAFGTSIIVGSNQEKIISTAEEFLTGKRKTQTKGDKNPYGDGTAAKQICNHLLKNL